MAQHLNFTHESMERIKAIEAIDIIVFFQPKPDLGINICGCTPINDVQNINNAQTSAPLSAFPAYCLPSLEAQIEQLLDAGSKPIYVPQISGFCNRFREHFYKSGRFEKNYQVNMRMWCGHGVLKYVVVVGRKALCYTQRLSGAEREVNDGKDNVAGATQVLEGQERKMAAEDSEWQLIDAAEDKEWELV